MKRINSFLAVVLGLSFIGAEAFAAKAGSTQPGTYSDWNDIDQVTIVQPFQSSSYTRVVVQPIDTKNAPLPDAKDNSYAAVKEALANSTQPFTEGLQRKLPGMQVQSGQGGGANAVVIRARITKSDPGSQAARYFVSFGAGAVKVGVTGEVVDGKTNKVLARFTQERRSGVGGFGGGYRDLLDRSLRQIGGDVAGLVKAF
jgi:hypothetical protein